MSFAYEINDPHFTFYILHFTFSDNKSLTLSEADIDTLHLGSWRTMEAGGIEESNLRLLRSGSNEGSSSDSRWVDGSEVDPVEVPPWSNEGRERYGSMRRRFMKGPKRVDSLDVEVMEIARSQYHHSKVNCYLCCCHFHSKLGCSAFCG